MYEALVARHLHMCDELVHSPYYMWCKFDIMYEVLVERHLNIYDELVHTPYCMWCKFDII